MFRASEEARRRAEEERDEKREKLLALVDIVSKRDAENVALLIQVRTLTEERDGWKTQAHDIAVSNANHVRWHREKEEENAALRAQVERLRAALDRIEYTTQEPA